MNPIDAELKVTLIHRCSLHTANDNEKPKLNTKLNEVEENMAQIGPKNHTL